MMKNVLIVSISSAMATALVLILLILPMTYEIDLSGLGKKLGINGWLKQSKSVAENNLNGKPAPTQTIGQPTAQPELTDIDSAGDGSAAHQQSFTLTVPAKQSQSFQFYMERDYDLSYNWATDGQPLYCELRGENLATKDNIVKVFGKLTERRGKGFFIPPFSGNYSLFWENKSDKPISIRLTAKGVYKPLG